MTATALRIATCKPLPEPDRDEAPLAAALAAGGFAAELVAWDDPAADWDAPIPTILRSTWNYPLALDAFLAWIDRASAAAVLVNPPEVVRDNVHKRYLLALAARGVPVVPTTVVERGQICDLAAVAARSAAASAASTIVIKPEVGAASLDARRFAPSDPAALAHLAALTARGAALVQPYVASVDSHGERSLVWIDGALSHAIRKLPRFAGDAERAEGPLAIADDERAVALAALAPIADRILYGRVDLARDAAGQPMVMELELVEPSLYLVHQPDAAARLVTGLRRYLDAAAAPASM
jgi:glutathione synthase/RimK-type ligase-like ATP-grasp enzyme